MSEVEGQTLEGNVTVQDLDLDRVDILLLITLCDQSSQLSGMGSILGLIEGEI